MASSLFQSRQIPQQQNKLTQLMNMVRGLGNPEVAFQQMYQSNPQFKKFVDENKDSTPQEIAKKYGIPL